MIGAVMLVIAITALLGAFFGQVTLNEHARRLTLSINDANRVMEQLRQRNIGAACGGGPTAQPPTGYTSWDAWLADTGAAGGGGKSIQPNPTLNERIVVTCQDQDGGSLATDYCGDANQVGSGEWVRQAAISTSFDPIRVTVSVLWDLRGRVLGEGRRVGGVLQADDTVAVANDTAGVIESPAMLSTLVTCRT